MPYLNLHAILTLELWYPYRPSLKEQHRVPNRYLPAGTVTHIRILTRWPSRTIIRLALLTGHIGKVTAWYKVGLLVRPEGIFLNGFNLFLRALQFA